MDCDGDGKLDLVRLFAMGYKSYSIQGAISCKQQGGELLCENHCFAPPDLTHAERGYAFGDWDNDGDLDLVVIKQGAAKEPFLMDNGFCVPEQACSGIGRCLASGQCSCSKDRSMSDCSGCAVGYYTPAFQIGRNVHGCETCPVDMKEAVCAGRGVCVDAYAHAQSLQQTNLTIRTRGNGSCICTSEEFVGLDQLERQTCAQGICPEGYVETAVNVTHLLHPQVQLSFGCEVCPAGSFSNGHSCEQCGPGHYAGLGSSICHACPAGSYSQAVHVRRVKPHLTMVLPAWFATSIGVFWSSWWMKLVCTAFCLLCNGWLWPFSFWPCFASSAFWSWHVAMLCPLQISHGRSMESWPLS